MADLEENPLDLPPSPSPKFFIKRSAFGSPKHAASHTTLKPALDDSDSGSSEDDNDFDSPLQQFLQATECESSKLTNPSENLAPAHPIDNKQYSMEPDMLFGWKPKYVPQVPVPLRFFSPLLEEVITTLHKPGSSGQFPEVVYQGFRPENTLIMHEKFGADDAYNIKFSPFVLAKHQFFCKFMGNNPINPKRPFMGMKEGVQKDCLVFDSIFEHGNLDTAIRKAANEYDLFLRVDSNTKGHTAWYYFTIKNMKKGQKVKFNILNLSKSDSLYQRGMKPYIYSQKLNDLKQTEWIQKGENVSYTLSNISYAGQTFEEPNQKKYYKLSFEYTFEYDNDTVSLALCAPYTYTRLVQYIQNLIDTQKASKGSSCLGTSKLCYSLGGISIPIITITDPDESEIPIAKRQYIVCTGRAHPGETNASWMIQGFISELCSDKPETKYLRKKFVFKIVPMLNPDGVVAGNHRTGVCGNDLNRKFVTPKEVLHPNIIALKDTVRDIVNNEKEVFAYLDFHGHSLKKNVFMYGAEFPVYDQNYYRVKILPKLLSKRNPMFRFRSCIFTLSKPKMTTARAVFSMKYGVAHFYTIEASYANYLNLNRETVPFDANGFMEMGASVAGGLHDYRRLLDEEEIAAASLKLKKEDLMKITMVKPETEEPNFERVPPAKMKSVQFKEDKGSARTPSENFGGGREIQENDKRKNKKFIIRKGKGVEVEGYQPNSGDVSMDSTRKPKQDSTRVKDVESKIEMRSTAIQGPKIGILSLMQEIREDFLTRKEEDKAESDSFSEGGSDSEGSEDDFTGEEMKKMQKNILGRVDKFQDICKNGEKYEIKSYRKEKKPKKAGTTKDIKSPKKEKPKAPAALIRKGSDQSPKERKFSEALKASVNRQTISKTEPEKTTTRVTIHKKEEIALRPSSSKPKFSIAPKEVQIDNNEAIGGIGQIKNQISSFYLGSLAASRKDGIFRNSMTAQSTRKQPDSQPKTEIASVRPVETDSKPGAIHEAAKIIHMNSQMEKNYQAQRASKSPLDLLFTMKGSPAPSALPEMNGEGEGFLNLHVDRLFKPALAKLKAGDYTQIEGLSKMKANKDAYSLDQDITRDAFGSPYAAKLPSYQPSAAKQQNSTNPDQNQEQETPSAAKQGSRNKPAFVRIPYMTYMTVATAQIYNNCKQDLAAPTLTPLKKDSKLPISFEAYKKMLHSRRKTEEAAGRKSTIAK